MVAEGMKSSYLPFYGGFTRGRRAPFGSKGYPLSSASAYSELLTQNVSTWHIYRAI